MDNQMQILNLINQKELLEYELNKLVYGAVEIREKDNKKYIYTHIKEDGLQSTKYIGEYNETLYNLILNNNIKAKKIKKTDEHFVHHNGCIFLCLYRRSAYDCKGIRLDCGNGGGVCRLCLDFGVAVRFVCLYIKVFKE